ncbi:hypothetical protein EDD22DRAFT_849316 [Suillus occidentalis]|nr:hypothetical protein EDD22DRAFT_849316 [Suillus occidentalis]
MSLCSKFADWLNVLSESEMDKHIKEAVEWDGRTLFHLIQCMLNYEHALQEFEDHADTVDTETSGHISNHTKALHDLANFLDAKARDGISAALSLAINQDGKQLFCLAKCCLSFTSAINSEGSESP